MVFEFFKSILKSKSGKWDSFNIRITTDFDLEVVATVSETNCYSENFETDYTICAECQTTKAL